MDPTFGARLRQQREERQVTLTTISTKTKIKVSLLEALESDDLSTWPKGLFGRAYLRDYATAIGLDPETVVSEFLALHPEFAYVTPEVEEAEAAARADQTRLGAAEKLRRLVSSAFSVRPARSAAAAAPGHAMERRRYEEIHPEPADGEIVSASMPHTLAEAQELVPPLVELDAREPEIDERNQPDSVDFPQTTEPLLQTIEPTEADPEAMPEFRLSFEVAPSAAAAAARREEHRDISLSAVADVCSRLARAIDWREVTTLLADAARLLDAVGLIVWQWDPRATALRPSLSCGYPDAMVARLPEVRTDDANAVATAFRSGERCIVDGDAGTEAIVVPSLGVGGCVGVLAVELRPGARERDAICAFASILAAQLAMLLPAPEPVEA